MDIAVAAAAAAAAATGDEHPDDVGIVTGGELNVGRIGFGDISDVGECMYGVPGADVASDISNSYFGLDVLFLRLPRFSIGLGMG